MQPVASTGTGELSAEDWARGEQAALQLSEFSLRMGLFLAAFKIKQLFAVDEIELCGAASESEPFRAASEFELFDATSEGWCVGVSYLQLTRVFVPVQVECTSWCHIVQMNMPGAA